MRDKPQAIPGAGALGLYLLIASLSMLFGASLLGYWIMRHRAATWPPAGTPPLSHWLWLSTLVILCSSVTIQGALRAIQRGDAPLMVRRLWQTAGLGLVFLFFQLINWLGPIRATISSAKNLYGFFFYMLTTLHALHVLGGLITLGWVLWKSHQGRYGRDSYLGLRQAVIYWHFLDIVWVILFLSL